MMFSKTWKTSESTHKVLIERDIRIPLRDGIEINADVFRPASDGKFPVIFAFHPYNQAAQTAPMVTQSFSINFFKNPGQEEGNAYIEAGDPYAFVPRGYVYVIANIRGTGDSGGQYPFLDHPEPQDGVEVIEWIGQQPWCDGNVGMFGVSYFAWIQFYIAALQPPLLKCIFAPWAATDLYRDSVYHGGILGHGFWRMWAFGSLYNSRVERASATSKEINTLLKDKDIARVPELVQILKKPDSGANPILVDILCHPYDGPFWDKRKVDFKSIRIPAYLGACWGIYGLHLPGTFRSWENMAVPKKMLIGPPAYLDRPLYQLQYESLRWFDYWLKGIDTGIMEEAPIKLFVMGSGDWKETDEWPLPETKWTPFFLHNNGLLYERQCRPDDGHDTFEDSPWGRGSLEYCSPKLVENTEIIGPIVLNLYASTSDDEVFWFISLREVNEGGQERILTRGWLRGTHREVDPSRSKPWEPFHPHKSSRPLKPGKVNEFNIPVVPTGNLFKAGSKIKLKISCTDDPPKNPLEMNACGHLHRQSASRIRVYHNADYPSHLLLPITKGNVLETFVSGGKPYL